MRPNSGHPPMMRALTVNGSSGGLQLGLYYAEKDVKRETKIPPSARIERNSMHVFTLCAFLQKSERSCGAFVQTQAAYIMFSVCL